MSTTYTAKTLTGYIFDEEPEGWDDLQSDNYDLFHTIGDYRGGDQTYVAGVVIYGISDCMAAYVEGAIPEDIRAKIEKAAPNLVLPDHPPRQILAMGTY